MIKQSDVRLISFNLSQAIRKAGSGHIVSEADIASLRSCEDMGRLPRLLADQVNRTSIWRG